MVGDGADGGVAFGGFDVGHWGGVGTIWGVKGMFEIGSTGFSGYGFVCMSVGLGVSMSVLVEAQ